MACELLNICINQGSDFLLEMTIKDEQGNPIDLTDHTFRGQIRKTVSDSVIQASFTFNKVDAPNGRVDVKLPAADSTAIVLDTQNTSKRKLQKMAYDIESETSGGAIERWLSGEALINPEVTRT